MTREKIDKKNLNLEIDLAVWEETRLYIDLD